MNGIAAHSNPVFDGIIPAPFGALGVRMAGEALAELIFLPEGKACIPAAIVPIAASLNAYFANPGFVFDLPLRLGGTVFRRRVWAALEEIPAGRTTTYSALARQLGSGARAVGQALGDNPIPIIVPCHRVLAARGLGGFMHTADDFPLTVKRWLLSHEGAGQF